MNIGTGELMGRRKAQSRRRPDIIRATEIRQDRGDVVLEERALTDDRGGVITQALGDRRAYLSRYLARGDITATQARAGERFAADYEHSQAGVPSQLDPAKLNGNMGGSSSRGMPALSGDPLAAAMARAAIIAIGPPLALVVISITVIGESASAWAERNHRPARDGMAVLRHALDALAFHYRPRDGREEGD